MRLLPLVVQWPNSSVVFITTQRLNCTVLAHCQNGSCSVVSSQLEVVAHVHKCSMHNAESFLVTIFALSMRQQVSVLSVN